MSATKQDKAKSLHDFLHAPYDFVPVSKFVHMPPWAHQVSHDVPFKAGLSGEIEYSLTNATALCVGGEQTKQADQSTLVKWAKNSQGQPVIPATSIKGMIRNVLEIASFGKMHLLDTNQQLSFRDLSSNSHYLTEVIQKQKESSGWLKYDSKQQKWLFTPCHCVKVKHSEIKRVFGKELKNEDDVLAKFDKIPLSTSCYATISEPKGKKGNRWAEKLSKERNNEQDQVKGHFMFTGPKIIDTKKHKAEDFEFSYFFCQRSEHDLQDNIKQEVNHLFANNNEKLAEYLQKNEHPEFGFPVFALLDKDKKLKIKTLGFAKMPRVPYAYQPHELLDHYQKKHQRPEMFDMAELILGTTREQAGFSLKSRVFFSDLQACQPIELAHSNYMILNSPKPTFYPAYVEQDRSKAKPEGEKDRYKDFNNKNNTLAGWKRYISFKPENESKVTNALSTDKSKVTSKMELAPKDSNFSGKLVFHNLLPEELGALLWSMRFGEDSTVFHSLGHGKSLGAGAVQLTITKADIRAHQDQAWTEEACMNAFTEHMNQHYQEASQSPTSNGWQESPQIQYLLALGRLEANLEVNTKSMVIEKPNSEQAGFTQAKNKKQTLPLFAGIERQELIKASYTSTAFAQGRLAKLFQDHQRPWNAEIEAATAKRTLQAAQKKQQEARKKQREAEAAERAKLAAMRPHERSVLALQKELETNDQSNHGHLISSKIQIFLDSAEVHPQDIQKLLELAEEKQFVKKKPSKKMKERNKEYKGQLDALKALFEEPSL
jgi:CRISPR-associated protein (TIGR03986 family)